MNAITQPLAVEVCEMINCSIGEVFSSMFKLTIEPTPLKDFRRDSVILVAGSVGFVGDVNGMIHIYVKAPFARTLASQMLGMSELEFEGDEMVNDVIGEMSNMVVGSIKSRLCDAGAACKLTIPSIMRGLNLHADGTSSCERHLRSFASGPEMILVEFLTQPST